VSSDGGWIVTDITDSSPATKKASEDKKAATGNFHKLSDDVIGIVLESMDKQSRARLAQTSSVWKERVRLYDTRCFTKKIAALQRAGVDVSVKSFEDAIAHLGVTVKSVNSKIAWLERLLFLSAERHVSANGITTNVTEIQNGQRVVEFFRQTVEKTMVRDKDGREREEGVPMDRMIRIWTSGFDVITDESMGHERDTIEESRYNVTNRTVVTLAYDCSGMIKRYENHGRFVMGFNVVFPISEETYTGDLLGDNLVLHRTGDLPASTKWSVYGAVEYVRYCINGENHRSDGKPAITEYFENGDISKCVWPNHADPGKMSSVEYYETGQLKACSFRDIEGRLHRTGNEPAEIEKYRDGKLKRAVYAIHGAFHRQGHNNPAVASYYSNGNPEMFEFYINGIRNRTLTGENEHRRLVPTTAGFYETGTPKMYSFTRNGAIVNPRIRILKNGRMAEFAFPHTVNITKDGDIESVVYAPELASINHLKAKNREILAILRNQGLNF
jgi:antitoxin component YwqK of YwqJK toxin-antitoxin module